MMPGMRGMNQKQMKAAMKRMGIQQEELDGVEEVLIKTYDKEIRITDAAVTVVTMQGQKTFQIAGNVEELEKEGAIPIEDIKLVAGQANVSDEEARLALEECDGEPAEAIIYLMSK
jgi:nascent polypeptide-associated complex subunit alpha